MLWMLGHNVDVRWMLNPMLAHNLDVRWMLSGC